jgi:16S rRNA G966 N2-methylase RsmD
MRFFLLGSLIMLMTLGMSCSQTSKRNTLLSAEEQRKQNKEEFEKFVKIISDEDSLNKYLVELEFSAKGIFDYCQKLRDPLMVARLVKAVYLSANNTQKAARQDFWADIRYNVYHFTQLVADLREPEDKTFLDIGCGSGQKLYAALCMRFDKVYGLEYSQESYDYARQFLDDFIKSDKLEIQKGDALLIDGKYYSEADFLYTYSPIKDNTLMAQLFSRAIENMKDGAIMLEVRMVYAPELKKKSKLAIPNVRGFLAVKKSKDKFFYKNINNPYDWVELKKI